MLTRYDRNYELRANQTSKRYTVTYGAQRADEVKWRRSRPAGKGQGE